ncbi:MAG: MFS transporter [Clostridiales bacterium]|nr:MFS transporter [Clostridiales bacterium]
MKNENKGRLMKLSILSVSLLLTSAACVSGNIPEMARSFSHMPLSSVEMLITVPSLTMFIFIILSNVIVKYIGSRKTVLAGLVLASVSGVLPAFTDSYGLILLSRAGLGAGFGLFNSLAVSMIGYFYEGEERARLIGFQSAFQSLGSAALSAAAGQLLKLNWHVSFFVYIIAVPILILFAFFGPDVPKESFSAKGAKAKVKIDSRVLLWSVFFMAFHIVYSTFSVKLAQLITENGYGASSDAGSILSIGYISGMIAGVMFGYIFKHIKGYILTFSLVVMGAAYLIFGFSGALFITAAGAVLNGIAYSLVVPYVFNTVNSIAQKGTETLSTSFLLVGANLGNTVTPYCLAGFTALIGSSLAENIFLSGSVIIFVSAVLFLIYTIKRNKITEER